MSRVRLHHINLSSPLVPQMDVFYRSVLGLDEAQGGASTSRILTDDGYSAPVSFLESGDVELHLGTTDLNLNFRLNQAINPVVTGHIAFRTNDIKAMKRRLEDSGVNYSDYGVFSIKDWYQIFFHDPAGNVIEVHQVMSE
jgi:glyoxylase I family protein